MAPLLFVAAAATLAPVMVAPFGRPVGNPELAATASTVPDTICCGGHSFSELQRPVLLDEVDDWWADDGAALIAEAVRPRPPLPTGLDLQSLLPVAPAVQLVVSRVAQTRP